VPYKNFWSARIENPQGADFIRQNKDRFGKGINVLWKIKNGKTSIQAIRFSKSMFDKKSVKNWLEKNGFHYITLEGENSMAKKSRRKKSVSKKVLDALRRGRQKLAQMRKSRKSAGRKRRRKSVYVPENLQPLVIKGEFGMSGKKRRKRKSRMHGELFGRQKRRSHKRRRRSYSGEFMGRRRKHYRRYRGDKSKTIVHDLMDAGMIAAGGIGAAMVAKFVPIKNAKIKAAVPLVLGVGIGLTKFGKKPVISKLATGVAAMGILALVKQFVPTIPTLAGDDSDELMGYLPTSPEEAALLGLPYEGEYDGDELMELPITAGESEEYMGAPVMTPADL
jgi:hypothetical protein